MPSETAEDAPAPSESLPRGPRWLASLIGAALLGGTYFAAGKLGLQLAVVNESATTVWPPTGIALAACLVWGPALAPGIFFGALFVNLSTSGSWPASLGIALGNTMEALAGYYLVRRYANGSRAFERVQDTFRFILGAAVISTALSASVGVLSLGVTGSARREEFRAVWTAWWLGDVGGDLIFAPLLILWCSSRTRASRSQLLEGAVLALMVLLLGWAVFDVPWASHAPNFALGFLAIPIALWASFRFRARGASTVVFLLSAVALWGIVRDIRPHPHRSKFETLVFLQAFLGALSVTALVVAAAVEERRKASEALRAQLQQVAQLNGRLDAQKDEIATYHGLMTHDISNISMALLGLAEQLLIGSQGELSPRQVDLIRRCNRQALEMNRIAENARMLVRVREKGLPVPGEPAYAREILNQAVTVVRDLHFDRSFELAIECPPDAKLAGVPLMENILVNLLDNAVRHTRRDRKPELHVKVRGESDCWVIEIEGGSPSAKDFAAALLEREVKGRRSTGHGIGLALVGEIIKRSGGSIAVGTAKRAEGEVFKVDLSIPRP